MPDDVPLIPRRIFFDNPDRGAVKLSPDGRYLSWLAPVDGVLNVWIAPRETPGDARAVTRDTGRGIQQYSWAYTGHHLLYLQDEGGDENWRIYAVDLDDSRVEDLTPLDGVQARIEGVSPDYPDRVVVGLNDRDPKWHDLYEINIVTGERRLLLEQNQFAHLVVDHDLQPRVGIELLEEGGAAYFLRRDDEWVRWQDVPEEDVMTTWQIEFDRSGKTFYLKDSRGRDTAALIAADLATDTSRELAVDGKADAEWTIHHPRDRRVQAVSFNYTRRRWRVLDPSIQQDMDYLAGLEDGELGVSSRTLDDAFWLVAFTLDDGPVRFYLYDREAKKATFLFTNRSALNGRTLAKMHSTVITARDGLDLVAYYTLPPGSDRDGDGLPDDPLPMVFAPHGGPWGRNYWGHNAWHAWLSSRGYAVLAVNFRASTGFGKAFVNAGDREWGGKIMDDQVDAVRWAIDHGIADPHRVAVMGGSFGGYSVLMNMVRTPELFACGVDLVGVANLVTWSESIPPYWKPYKRLFARRVGDPETPEGLALLKAQSPTEHVDRIERPLLIGQGANDPRVKQHESDQIAEAMNAKGLPVAYLLYPDEGHGFARPENNRSFYAAAEAFLAKHLGGRCEPIGDDLAGSSVEVVLGAEQVPGLEAAMSVG